jgi:hypothetical protein
MILLEGKLSVCRCSLSSAKGPDNTLSSHFYLEDGLLVVCFSRFDLHKSYAGPAKSKFLFVDTKTGFLIFFLLFTILQEKLPKKSNGITKHVLFDFCTIPQQKHSF